MIEIAPVLPLVATAAATAGFIGFVLGVLYARERDAIRKAARDARREMEDDERIRAGKEHE